MRGLAGRGGRRDRDQLAGGRAWVWGWTTAVLRVGGWVGRERQGAGSPPPLRLQQGQAPGHARFWMLTRSWCCLRVRPFPSPARDRWRRRTAVWSRCGTGCPWTSACNRRRGECCTQPRSSRRCTPAVIIKRFKLNEGRRPGATLRLRAESNCFAQAVRTSHKPNQRRTTSTYSTIARTTEANAQARYCGRAGRSATHDALTKSSASPQNRCRKKRDSCSTQQVMIQ